MSEWLSMCCNVCGALLKSGREQNMLICFECRGYGLLYGCWPVPAKISNCSETHHHQR
jgi:hypothetical protein